MKALKLLFATVALLLMSSTMQAQFGKSLGKAIENAAKKTVERKVEQKTEQTVGGAIDKVTNPNSYIGDDTDNNQSEPDNSGDAGNTNASGKASAPQQGVKAAEMAYAKSDFVPGDEIIFDDDQSNEQMGEFPSMWDLISGNAEIASINGRKAINFAESSTTIVPLMKNMNSYLPDVFTIELDFYVTDTEYRDNATAQIFWLQLHNERNDEIGYVQFGWYDNVVWNYTPPGDNRRGGEAKVSYIPNSWNRFSVSFNKRAFKVYINGIRVANVPNMVGPQRFRITNRSSDGAKNHKDFISNIRIAKGAVPLYDRMMTDGKIITYGITFDVGKSTIKPESMSEINRIATLMKDNPDLKFSVEGHTDSTGNAASNQTLSDARSQAVVDKLVEMGISRDRLKSAGKGQTSPIADNNTDEGRAKNRRVEFVKIK